MHGMPIAYTPLHVLRYLVGTLFAIVSVNCVVELLPYNKYPGVRLKKLGAAVGAVSSSSPSTTTRSAPKINNGAAYETAESA